jgi:hypothetical protein
LGNSCVLKGIILKDEGMKKLVPMLTLSLAVLLGSSTMSWAADEAAPAAPAADSSAAPAPAAAPEKKPAHKKKHVKKHKKVHKEKAPADGGAAK